MNDETHQSIGARAALWSVRAYRGARANQLSPCRFTPSCSAYAEEAIETKGFFRGGGAAIWRVLRCNPFGGHGVDLVRVSSGARR